MALGAVVLLSAIALGFTDAFEPAPAEARVPDVQESVQESLGCLTFHIRANPQVAARADSIACGTGALRLEMDTSPRFDGPTQTLLLPIVLRNSTAQTVIVPARLTFRADESTAWNASGDPLPGPATITAVGDSGSVDGRVMVWRFDTLLAPSGQPQQLAPGARTRRLWLAFQSPNWTQAYRVRLFAQAVRTSLVVPPVAPDSVPDWVLADSNIVDGDPGIPIPFARHMVIVIFKSSATQAERQAAVASVGATVVGGRPFASGDGLYYLRLPFDSTSGRVRDAVRVLNSHPAVGRAAPVLIFVDQTTYLRPHDAGAFTKGSWRIRPGSSIAMPTAAPDSAPAWMLADSSIVRFHNTLPAPFVKNVLAVEFVPSATASQRQAALDSVRGEVIGGTTAGLPDGLYYVRIPADPTHARLVAAIAKLAALAQVDFVDFVIVPPLAPTDRKR